MCAPSKLCRSSLLKPTGLSSHLKRPGRLMPAQQLVSKHPNEHHALYEPVSKVGVWCGSTRVLGSSHHSRKYFNEPWYIILIFCLFSLGGTNLQKRERLATHRQTRDRYDHQHHTLPHGGTWDRRLGCPARPRTDVHERVNAIRARAVGQQRQTEAKVLRNKGNQDDSGSRKAFGQGNID